MSEKYKILSGYVKDLSSETPNVESYLYTKDNVSKYELDIDINSKPLKDKLIEVNTTLKFQDKSQTEKKSYFEVVYSFLNDFRYKALHFYSKSSFVITFRPTTIFFYPTSFNLIGR